ncbi:transposase [Trichodesmium erythraeum]|uniref:transposase n=1 Tax=Trichodesmium erythraeum TaxID=1206 RepID=UPI00351B123B
MLSIIKLNNSDNIILIFQPSYCPEFNLIERLWLAIKQKLKWIILGYLSDLFRKDLRKFY